MVEVKYVTGSFLSETTVVSHFVEYPKHNSILQKQNITPVKERKKSFNRKILTENTIKDF